jgi:uncharacterized protein YjbI with pentapeptide repeats
LSNDVTIAELLSNVNISDTFDLVADTTGDFSQLVQLLQLDKSCDFVFSNLSEVDFSNADLRGFNFTGADLRNSYGVDVLIDDTTNLEGADVQGSCFATYKRERELFQKKHDAGAMYEALRSGNPYEFSHWVHARFTGKRDTHPVLRKMDNDTATILCQKLIADEIDLTKRTDLFYNIRNITGSSSEMRELILYLLARHASNTSVINRFLKIAGSAYSNDKIVAQAILTLTNAIDEHVRETAFITISRTNFFLSHFQKIRSAFMLAENKNVRRRLLNAAAIEQGRPSQRAISLRALSQDVPLDEILDYSELLNEEIAGQIAAATMKREWDAARLIGDGKTTSSDFPAGSSANYLRFVLEKQEEVLCATPVIKIFFALDHPERFKRARARLTRNKSQLEQFLERKQFGAVEVG